MASGKGGGTQLGQWVALATKSGVLLPASAPGVRGADPNLPLHRRGVSLKVTSCSRGR